jgi:endonuclease III
MNHNELEQFLLFWILAAGKSGLRAGEIINRISNEHDVPLFKSLRKYTLNGLIDLCIAHGTGCQKIKAKAIFDVIHKDLNLHKCTIEDLEKVYGIGPKTARCFVVHSRQTARYACLDTHILKFLKIMGIKNVPKSTPTSKREYLRLETDFLALADKYNYKPYQLDLLIWNEFKR